MHPVRLLRCLRFFILPLLFFTDPPRATEAPAANWVQFIGGKSENISYARLFSDPAGGFFFSSSSERPLIRFAENGAIQWQIERVADLNDINDVPSVDVLINGDLAATVIASSHSPALLFGQAAVADAIHLARLSSTGELISLWPVANGWINTVKALGDGSFLAAGFGSGVVSIGPNQINVGADGFFLASFKDTLQWARVGHSAGGSFENSIAAIRPDVSGDIFIAGTATAAWSFESANVNGPGVFLARLDSSGAPRWAQNVSTGGVFQAVAKNLDGPFQLLASKSGQQWIASISRDGVTQWQKPLSASAVDIATSATGDRIFIIGSDQTALRWFIEALDSEGNSLWRRSDPARARYSGQALSVLNNGRIVAAATVTPIGIFVDDFFAGDFSLVGVNIDDAFIAEFDPSPNAPPVFRSQPTPHVGIVGERMTLRASVYSPLPVTFRWLRNDQPIPGETASQLVRPSLQANDAGDYLLIATSSAGEARSRPVHVSINATAMEIIAGSGEQGFANNPDPLVATFTAPRFPIALSNSVLVVESSNRIVRKITGAGVTTFVGATAPLLANPVSLALQTYSEIGPRILLTDAGANGIRAISFALETELPLNISIPQGTDVLRKPASIATSDGLAYRIVAEAEGSRLWSGTDEDFTQLAGAEPGFVDGPAATARFGAISGLAMDLRGVVYICDKGNNAIRKLDLDGTVSTLAGTNVAGLIDGRGADARFRSPSGIAVDADGNLFVTDTGNNALRRISPAGDATTLATDLNAPEGVAVRFDGSLVIADTGNNRIRALSFTTIQSTPNLVISISLDSGFAITLAGPAGDYFLESAPTIPSPNENWQFEALLTITDQPVVQPLERPFGTRFYRARLAQ